MKAALGLLDTRCRIEQRVASAVPACVKAWLLMKIAEMHPAVKEPMPEFVSGLLDPERVTGRIST